MRSPCAIDAAYHEMVHSAYPSAFEHRGFGVIATCAGSVSWTTATGSMEVVYHGRREVLTFRLSIAGLQFQSLLSFRAPLTGIFGHSPGGS